MTKTIAMVEDRFYCLASSAMLFRNLLHARLSKEENNTGIYTPLAVPHSPWQDLSLDFLLGLTRTMKGHASVLIVMDSFCKDDTHFIPCSKIADTSHVATIFFNEVVQLLGPAKTIVSDHVKFMSYFWNTLWRHPVQGSSFLLHMTLSRMAKLNIETHQACCTA